MKRSLITLTIISVFLALYLIGCGGGDGVTGINSLPQQASEGTLEITVPWDTEASDLGASLIQPSVAKILVEVKSTLDGAVTKSVTITRPANTGTISGVATGETYIDFKGLDATDSIITRRTKRVTIVGGTNNVTAILGIQIIGGKLSPRNLPISPKDILYFANSDNVAYIIRFNVNGQPARIDLPALSGLATAESVFYTFPDSLLSASSMSLYTSETGAAIDTIDYTVQLPSGQNYTNVGVWGIQGAYDANYGCTFVAADQDANFYVAVYDPYSRQSIATDNINYAPYYVNHIEKYDSSGKHLTSSTGGFTIDTTGIVQLAGIAVDPEGRYIYVTDCAGDDWFNGVAGTIGGTGVVANGVSSSDTAGATLGLGGRVLRFDARNSSVWRDMGHPQLLLGYVDPVGQTGGFAFGENNGLAVSNDGRSLYVAEFYRHVVTGGNLAGNFLVHRCDLTNINTPVWDNNATALGGAYPISLTALVAPISIDFRIIYPKGVAASTSGEIYILGTVLDPLGYQGEGAYVEPSFVGTTNQRIVTYKGLEGTRVSRNYPPASLGTFPVMDCITGIAAYNVPSAGNPIDEAVFAMDWDGFSTEANDLYKYDGGQWKTVPFKTPFSVPAPYDFTAGGDGAIAPYPITAGYPGGGTPQVMTVAVCPNQTQEIYAGDAFHRVWKLDKSGNEVDRWRLLYREYANPSGIDTDSQSNVYVVDNINCRILKYQGSIAGNYITQWGTPPYFAVANNLDLINWYDANRDNRELGNPGPNGIFVHDPTFHIDTVNAVPDGFGGRVYPLEMNALPNINNLAAGEFYYPWGIAVDKTNNAVFVVDWAHDIADPLVIPTFAYNTGGNGRVQKFQSPSDITTGKMSSRVTGTGVEWYQSVQHKLWYPTGISYGSNFVWVCDTFSDSAINPIIPAYGYGIVQKFLSDGTQGIVSFAAAEGKQIVHPWGVATDVTNSQVYLSDTENHRVLLYDLNTSAFKSRVSTAGTTAGTGKGQFNLPAGCGLDDGQNLYVVDGFNRRMQKNLANSGGWIDAWDVNNLNNPLYTAVDRNNMVYTTDSGNHRVKLYLPQN
jgi:hypothetical protein